MEPAVAERENSGTLPGATAAPAAVLSDNENENENEPAAAAVKPPAPAEGSPAEQTSAVPQHVGIGDDASQDGESSRLEVSLEPSGFGC
jgi:hypothetical protein